MSTALKKQKKERKKETKWRGKSGRAPANPLVLPHARASLLQHHHSPEWHHPKPLVVSRLGKVLGPGKVGEGGSSSSVELETHQCWLI